MDDLEKKLGLKEGLHAFVMHAPPGYTIPVKLATSLTDIPENVDWIQAFYKDKRELLNELGLVIKRLDKSGILWLSWPKKSSGVESNLSDAEVRKAGLNAGLVDVKVASITEVWSGIKFVYRLSDR